MIMRGHRGFTVIELIVAITVFVLLTGIAGIAITATRLDAPVVDDSRLIQQTRTQAIRSGARVTVVIATSTGKRHLTAFPDGSVVADSSLRLDALTGRPSRDTR